MAIDSFLQRQTYSDLLDDTYKSDDNIFNLYLNNVIDEKTYEELSNKMSTIKDNLYSELTKFDKKQLNKLK